MNEISLTPDLLLDYTISDSNNYIPYFMNISYSKLNVGVGEPKFFSFSASTSYNYNWGFKMPGEIIRKLHANTRLNRWHSIIIDKSTHMGYSKVYRGDLQMFMNSLFIMQSETTASNILMIGVIKEEDAVEVRDIYKRHKKNLNKVPKEVIPFIEIWLADDFDIKTSSFPRIKTLYRKVVRRFLIDNNFKIKLKPRAELNKFIIERKIKFKTIELLHSKLNDICRKAAEPQVLKLEFQTM